MKRKENHPKNWHIALKYYVSSVMIASLTYLLSVFLIGITIGAETMLEVLRFPSSIILLPVILLGTWLGVWVSSRRFRKLFTNENKHKIINLSLLYWIVFNGLGSVYSMLRAAKAEYVLTGSAKAFVLAMAIASAFLFYFLSKKYIRTNES